MYLLLLLILVPLAAALIILLLKDSRLRNAVVYAASGLIAACSIILIIVNYHHDVQYYKAFSRPADTLMLCLEIAIAGYLLYAGLKFKRYWTCLLVSVQAMLIASFDLLFSHKIIPAHNLFVDRLSIVMALVIGVIGSLICMYATGYMRDFHANHREVKDRCRFFFVTVFVFLSAMFGIVFSNNLLWLYFFWEITTLCSFLLIGYKQSEESARNAFRALELNLLGGVAFAIAIIALYASAGTIELDKALMLGGTAALLPAMLICFAGLAKSAQLPFSSWLLGAMVAPTPVSALLHSSTMVKAGVYIILKFAPVLQGTLAGLMLAFIGGLTFFFASLIAITQSDAKKVLAYSTVANLGLIVLCGGVGTYEAVWAAILLIIFHAIAKCLLFLCVGSVENRLHSRDIEDMSGLIVMMPRMSIMMQIGMAGMFLAPFGMLISKWAVLKALVDYNPILAVFVAFGSSATLFFWVKWIGKLITVVDAHEESEHLISTSEWVPLWILSCLTIGICGLFPVVSNILIEPYIIEIYGKAMALGTGNIIIMLIMLGMVMLFPLSFLSYGKKVKVMDAYLAGINAETNTQFRGSLGEARNMEMKNYYIEAYFGEPRLLRFGAGLCIFFIVMMFGVLAL